LHLLPLLALYKKACKGLCFSTQIIDNFHENFCFGFLSLFFLILPHDHFGVLEVYFSLQIRLVRNLDAWSDFLDIPKKAFNWLPLYRVQKLKRYSLNVKLSKEYLMNHLTPLPYYLIWLLVYLLYNSPYKLLRFMFEHYVTRFDA